MPSLEMVTAISSGVVGLGSIAGTVAVARAGRRTPRQESRDDLALMREDLRDQKAEIKEQRAEWVSEVRDLREEIAEEREGRQKDQRSVNALARYVKKLLATLRLHGIDPPDPDSGDEPELAAHGIP